MGTLIMYPLFPPPIPIKIPLSSVFFGRANYFREVGFVALEEDDIVGKTVFFIALIAFYSGAMILIPKFLTEEAAARLIQHFRDHGATTFWSARTIGEMKLDSRNTIETGLDGRWDYRPVALEKLIDSGIVRKIGDEKLFLSEKGLADYCKSEDRLNVC